jgi:hypothetical protein
MTDIMTGTVEFIQQRESAAVKQALQAATALRAALALKREIGVPVLAETRDAIAELKERIVSLKLECVRAPHHPDQLPLPGMEDLSKEGKHEAGRHRNDASCPALVST